jgi:hypothetical protein
MVSIILIVPPAEDDQRMSIYGQVHPFIASYTMLLPCAADRSKNVL